MADAPSGVRIEGESAPKFTMKLVHGPSGTLIQTEAPKDNGGTGGSFSPTDLVGAALMACAVTTMALFAQRNGFTLGPVRARIEKRMANAPRRIAELPLEFDMPPGLTPAQRSELERTAHECPVARALAGNVQMPMVFHYPDAE